MFTRVFALLPLALLASASHLEARDVCSSGSQYCCQSTQSFSKVSQILPGISTVIGVVDVNAFLGFVCSPLVDVVGESGCTAQTVCCEDNKFGGLVAVGCNNINI